MGGVDTGARIAFTADGETLRVRDLIEGKEMVVEADREIDPVPALTDLFVFPVDRAVSFETESIHLPSHGIVQLYGEDGEYLEKLLDPVEYPRSTYLFDVVGDVRTYIRVEGVGFATSGRNDDDSFTIEFDDLATVTAGSRSLHTRPEGTIVVPDEPTAAMEAISHLGSSIKEFSAERSWPTLRGHPPRTRRGDRLEIPDSIRCPETGVRLEVPPAYSEIYRIAPLGFYLGASVEPGDEAAIHLENGYTEPLRSSGRSLSETVEELLKRCLLLDSLVRIGGYIPSRRLEYEELGPDLPFYPPNLYDATLSEQLLEYLEVERSVLEPYFPTWSTTAVLRPDPADVELLPYLAHTLSPIRVSETPVVGSDGEENSKTVPYSRLNGRIPDFSADGNVPSMRRESLPPNTGLLNAETYENALDLPPAPPGEATVALVTDCPERGHRWREKLEGLADSVAGIDAVETIVRPERERFRALFGGEYDMVYVALPAKNDEVMCVDGTLRVSEIEDVRVRSVLFEDGPSVQAIASVIRNGGVAGAVIAGAVSVDQLREFLEALGIGLSLGQSVRVSSFGDQYEVRFVGDPGHPLVVGQRSSAPHVVNFEPVDVDQYTVTTHSFLSVTHRAGEEMGFHADWMNDRAHLLGTRRSDFRPISTDELLELAAFDDLVIATPEGATADPERFTEEDVKREVRRSR